MKTWKKTEDTRKRTNEIVSLKNRNEERLRQVSWRWVTGNRKSGSTKKSKRWSGTNRPKTIWFKSKGLKKRGRSRRQFSCRRLRKRSKLKLLGSRMSSRFGTTSSRWRLRTRWRIKLLTSKSDWPRWRWRRSRDVRFKWLSATSRRKQQLRKPCDRPRRMKCWIWSGLRWSWSKSFRTLKPSRKRPTKN